MLANSIIRFLTVLRIKFANLKDVFQPYWLLKFVTAMDTTRHNFMRISSNFNLCFLNSVIDQAINRLYHDSLLHMLQISCVAV